MTPFQSKQIRELRLRGVGYKGIASVTGLTRDIVRNYCKTHGLSGLGAVVTINIKEQMESGVACLGCGKPLVQPRTGRPRKFCSDKCRRDWWAAHADRSQPRESAMYTATCSYCGQEFRAYGNSQRKYCCHACYIRDRFWREEDGREPYRSPAQQMEGRS